MRLIGIDGCTAGWVVASSQGGLPDLQFEIVTSLESVFDQARRNEAQVVIDVPIGLMNGEPRQCDIEARKILSKRHKSSVFPAPARCTLQAYERDQYALACKLSIEACGKSLSRQAHGILPKIKEVDDLIDPELQAKGIREAHPEVTFACLSGQPLRHSKKTPEGEQERLELLKRIGISFDVGNERMLLGRGIVARDDIIDAAACLATALANHRDQLQLFPTEPHLDARGLRMEIVAPVNIEGSTLARSNALRNI